MFSLTCFLIHVLAVVLAGDCAKPKRPNIVFFLVDDMGWNDVGYHGMTEIPTPNIDALAYNSIILNNYYTHPACSPSRSALLSGRYATSTGLQHYVILDPQRVGLPLDMKVLPQYMKMLGYKTHMIGKWHLGFYEKEYTPLFRGFDSHYGFWEGDTDLFFHETLNEYNRTQMTSIPCYEKRDKITVAGISSRDGFKKVNKQGTYLTYTYTDRAVDIINNIKINKHGKHKPVFLYLAHHGVHRGNSFQPVRAPEPLTDRFTNINDDLTRKNFAGALTAIDISLGRIMEALEKKNMLEDTIIVFSSDNGSPLPGFVFNGGSNYPFRGGKLTAWQGGVRTNAFVWKSDFKQKGLKYDGLMDIVDWAPTLFSAAGGTEDIAKKYKLDAVDMWDAIVNNKPSPRKNVMLQSDSLYNYLAYLSGDYKLISGQIQPPPDPNLFYGVPGRRPPPPDVPNDSSLTEQVLKRAFGNNVQIKGEPIEIFCGDLSRNVSCDTITPGVYCLYNLKDDPCELRNIAALEPETVARLREELSQIKVVEPNFPLLDYGASPVYYGGYWSSWADIGYNYNSTSC